MRCPSATRLVETFKIDRKAANLVRRIARAVDMPPSLAFDPLAGLIELRCPDTHAYVRSLHSSPYRSRMWRVTVALHAIDRIVGTCGVESLGEGDSRDGYAPPFEYLNAGDTYTATLIYNRSRDNLYIGSWGTLVESRKVRS